jgi:hypothetical protein
MNLNATGGYNWGDYELKPWGPYGLALDPKTVWKDYTQYNLGAKVEIFRNPAYTYLVTEAEYRNPTQHGVWPYRDVLLPGCQNLPPWCGPTDPSDTVTGNSGAFAFRHLLSADKKYYQQTGRANAVHIDSHVTRFAPTDKKVNASDRFSP